MTETLERAQVDEGAPALLRAESISMAFAGVKALQNVSFDVAAGSITGLIGSNGAGKSTLFNCVSGIYRPDSGSVWFDGRNILRMPARTRSRLGIARSFQNVALFEHLNVLENVLIGAHPRVRSGILGTAFHLPRARQEERELREEAMGLLADWGLSDAAQASVTTLPYGTRKRIELLRALMAHPSLLMLDEPAAGLPHGEVRALADEIRRINSDLGITVVLVEHHMGMVMSTCHRVVVLDHGQVIAAGAPQEVQADQNVISAYLGG